MPGAAHRDGAVCVTAISESEFLDLVRGCVRNLTEAGVLPRSIEQTKLSLAMPVADLPIDSLGRTELLLALEALIGRELGIHQLPEDASLADVRNLCEHALLGDCDTAGIPDEDGDGVSVSFNVMLGRVVSESTRFRKVVVTEADAVGIFDRTYRSEMLHSPDHLIVLTFLVQCQYLIYRILCCRFGVEFDSGAPERFKIWPVGLNVSLPALVTQRRFLQQKVTLQSIRKDSEIANKYFVEALSECGAIKATSTCAVYVL
jgi:hypothetical protein